MLYLHIERDCHEHNLKVPVIVRKATKQAGSFAVLATEQLIGGQVLLMAGRMGRDRIPIVYPDDKSVAHIMGSCLVRTRGQELCGVLGFASDYDAQATRERYLVGELTLQMTTKPIAGVELRRGESFSGVDGPACVVTQWEPLQVVLG